MGIVIAGALSGCSPAADPNACDADASTFVDKSLEDFASCVQDDTTLIIQDASPRVGEEATFRDVEGERGRWIVVASCSNDEDWRLATVVEVAVIPTPHVSGEADFGDAVVCDW